MNYAVCIIDLDKLQGDIFKNMFLAKGTMLYIAKIQENSYQKVTDAVDKIQETEIRNELV
jgi:hypothetical protein